MDPLTLGLFAVLAIMIFFMFRNSRKRAREAEELRAKIQPGAEIMTQHGIYGTLLSLDAEKNEAVVETTPGTLLRVHSQTISKVIEPEAEEGELESAEDAEAPLESAEPEFGERAADDKPAAPGKPEKAAE